MLARFHNISMETCSFHARANIAVKNTIV